MTVVLDALEKVNGGAIPSEEARHETLQNIAVAMEQRDRDASSHLHRMSEYAAILARAAGQSDQEVEVIRIASIMHDVGKLAVPNSIIKKQGALNPVERKVVQVHAAVGAKMLAGSKTEFMQVGEVIARTHHERWDGSGYPAGLRGEEIPLVGRICAIADVFDALTSIRAYKDAFSLEKTWNIMEQGRGTHFDPILLDLFFAKRLMVEKIYHQPEGDS